MYTHDAWNRLVKVQNEPLPSGSPTTLSEYEYNGLHWRTVKRHDTSTPADGLDQHTRLYYDASWRVVEERVDENYISSAGVNRHMQSLWGARYIDDLVARRRDANMDGDCLDAGDATFYAVTDVQFSVVAMLSSTGKLHERVAYDSYGTARHHWMDDVDGDGDVDTNDTIAVAAGIGKSIYQAGFNPSLDIDRSGTIDSTDKGMVSSSTIAALAAGEISDRSATGLDNVLGYDGYVFNAECLLYTVRFRHYDTGPGRWLERDPAGYVDGLNFFEYVGSYPASGRDPSGAIDDSYYEWREREAAKKRPPCSRTETGVLILSLYTVQGDGFWWLLRRQLSLEGWEAYDLPVTQDESGHITRNPAYDLAELLEARQRTPCSTCIDDLKLSGHGSKTCGIGCGPFHESDPDEQRFLDADMPLAAARRISATLCKGAIVRICGCGQGNLIQMQRLSNKLDRRVCACTANVMSPCICKGTWRCVDPDGRSDISLSVLAASEASHGCRPCTEKGKPK